MHGTHQLAKMLRMCGCPVANSFDDSAGFDATAAGSANVGSDLPSSFDETFVSTGVARRQTRATIINSRTASGAKRTARVMRSAPGANPAAVGGATLFQAAPA